MDPINLSTMILIITFCVLLIILILAVLLNNWLNRIEETAERAAREKGYSLSIAKWKLEKQDYWLRFQCNKDGFLHLKSIVDTLAHCTAQTHCHVNGGGGYIFYNLIDGKDTLYRKPEPGEFVVFSSFYSNLSLQMNKYFQLFTGGNREIEHVKLSNHLGLLGIIVSIDDNMA